MKNFKKIISMVLALVMIIGILPISSLQVYALDKSDSSTELENLYAKVTDRSPSGWQRKDCDPKFDPATKRYTIAVEQNYTDIYFYIGWAKDGQTFEVKMNGNPLTLANAANGFTTDTKSLKEGSTEFAFKVTSKDKTKSDTYYVTVIKGDVANLKKITVKNGTANKTMAFAGDYINIDADPAPAGKVFKIWQSDKNDIRFTRIADASTGFTMPDRDVTVEAIYKTDPETSAELDDIVAKVKKSTTTWETKNLNPVYDRETKSYTLTVDKDYNTAYFYLAWDDKDQTIVAKKDGVNLKLDPPLSSGYETIATDLTNLETVFTFEVTSKDKKNTNTYTVNVKRGNATDLYNVDVVNGTAKPNPAYVGDIVYIDADTAPAGKVFDYWQKDGNDITILNPTEVSTRFKMPARNVKVEAIYKIDPAVSAELKDIKAYVSGPGIAWDTFSITPNYDRATKEYTLAIPNKYNVIYFFLAWDDEGQKIVAKKDGVDLGLEDKLSSGYNTKNAGFTDNASVYTFEVTSKDGKNTNTYKVTVTREASPLTPVNIPTANTNLVYNENPQIGVNEGTGYKLTDNTATNAGTYTAKATLEPGYKWSDGSTEVKEITWTIAKARPTYTEPTNLTGKKGEKLSTVALPAQFKWKNGDLTLDTVGDNTYYATFTPADTKNYEVIDVDLTVKVEDEVKLTNIKIKALIGSGWQYLDPPLPYNENTKEYTLELDNKMDNIQIELTCDTSKLKATLKQKGIEDAIRLDDKGTYYISAPIHMWEERIEEFTIELSKGGIVVDTYVLKIKRKGNNFIEIEEPTVTASFVYDGTEKVAIQDGTGYTLLNHKHRNAGDYLARVTLKPGYTWKKHGVTVLTYDWKIEKADPTYTVPTGLKGQKGAKLSTVTLPSGFTWVDGEEVLDTAGEMTFKAKFTPADTKNYNVVEVDVKVMVEDNTTPPPVPTNPVKPTVKKPKNFTYDGTEKQVTLINFDEGTMTLSGDVKKTDAGSYTLYISSKTGTWSDGSTDAMEVEWEIRKAKVEGTVNVTPITEDGKTIQDVVSTPNFTFNGQKVDGTIVWIAPDFTALPLTTEVVYQQSYTWLFKPTSGNFNQVSGTAVIYPTKAGQETVIDVPVANQNLTYNGTEQIGVNEGTGYTLTNSTATNAGNYTATATLDAGYKWSDDTKEVKNIPFEIRKAVPSFTAPTNLTGKKGSALSTVTLPSDFAWVDGTKILDKVGDIEFVAVYTPQDTENYESVNVVLTVKVEENITPPTPMTYTVSFDGNSGGGAMSSATVNAGDIYKLPACTFTPPVGKEFKAWEVNGDEKTAGTDITINADTVLIAVWKDKSVTPPTPPTPPTPSIPDVMPLPFGPGYNPFWMIYFGPVGQVESKHITKVTTKVTLTIDSKIMEKSVNGIEEKITMDVAPFIIDGRTMLPIRFVAEALGFNVQWINETRTVLLTDKDNVITIPVDTNKIVVNGKVYESDVKPVIKNGRTMLPIANIARALGLKDGTEILWDEVSRKVTIIREQVIDNR